METCSMKPCPFCTLEVAHDAEQEDIAQALQRGARQVALKRLTMFQFGMFRCAAAEALHSSGFASSQDEAKTLVFQLEVPSSSASGPTSPGASTAPSSLQLHPSMSFAPVRATTGRLHRGSPARSSGGSSAAASSLLDRSVSIFAPPPSQRVRSRSRAASASSAWLAPELVNEAADGGHLIAQSAHLQLALLGQGPQERPTSTRETSQRDDEHVWQVCRSGRRWETMNDNLVAILEESYGRRGAATRCMVFVRGYRYDLLRKVRTSETTGADRLIRRIPYSQAHPEMGDHVRA